MNRNSQKRKTKWFRKDNQQRKSCELGRRMGYGNYIFKIIFKLFLILFSKKKNIKREFHLMVKEFAKFWTNMKNFGNMKVNKK